MDAEVITTVAALFGNTLAVVVGAWLAARAATAAKLAAETVHTIVNSQQTIMLRALHVLTARARRCKVLLVSLRAKGAPGQALIPDGITNPGKVAGGASKPWIDAMARVFKP